MKTNKCWIFGSMLTMILSFGACGVVEEEGDQDIMGALGGKGEGDNAISVLFNSSMNQEVDIYNGPITGFHGPSASLPGNDDDCCLVDGRKINECVMIELNDNTEIIWNVDEDRELDLQNATKLSFYAISKTDGATAQFSDYSNNYSKKKDLNRSFEDEPFSLRVNNYGTLQSGEKAFGMNTNCPAGGCIVCLAQVHYYE